MLPSVDHICYAATAKSKAMKSENGIKIASYLCLLVGAFLIVSGILLLGFPVAAGALYDLPIIGILSEPVALGMGIRQLAIGLMICVLVFSKQYKALAYVMLIGAIVPIGDFCFFCLQTGVVSALRHLAAVPMIVGLGIYLLLQLRKSR